jgi:hypothetical protein
VVQDFEGKTYPLVVGVYCGLCVPLRYPLSEVAILTEAYMGESILPTNSIALKRREIYNDRDRERMAASKRKQEDRCHGS